MPDANSITWLIMPVTGPLALGFVAVVVGPRWGARLTLAASLTVVVSTGAITSIVWQGGPQSYPLGDWSVPLGIALYADGLTCAMLWMSAAVGSMVSVYGWGDFAESRARRRSGTPGAEHASFGPLWLLLWSALHGLFLSHDVFNLYVTLELLTLSAIGLVALAGTRAAVEAALRYLLAALVGSLFYLASVALLYGAYGTLDIATLHAAAVDDRSLKAALLLAMLGLMLKSALFPFHFWLPPAHGSAPAPVSAMLSALVVTGSFYVLLRLWFDLFPQDLVRPVALLPAMLGAAAVVWGSVQAIVAKRLKMLIAYSTVAQIGYLFLVFGLATPHLSTGRAAWSAAVLFALSHGLAKGALFLAAGTILRVAGHDRVRDLSDLSRRLPVTFFAIGAASVTMMGLPPTGAFAAKWVMLKAAFDGGHVALAVVIVAGGLLAAGYMFRVLAAAFARPDDDDDDDAAALAGRTPRALEYAALALALASLLLGLAASPVIELIEIGSPFTQAIAGEAGP